MWARSCGRRTPATSRVTLHAVTNTAWNIAGAGDYDGDRKADLLWRNAATGENVVWRAAQAGNQMKVATTAVDWMPVN